MALITLGANSGKGKILQVTDQVVINTSQTISYRYLYRFNRCNFKYYSYINFKQNTFIATINGYQSGSGTLVVLE